MRELKGRMIGLIRVWNWIEREGIEGYMRLCTKREEERKMTR